MEEILSSIKRIIAEDSDAPTNEDESGEAKSRKDRGKRESDRASHRQAVVASMADEPSSYIDEVLELTDEMPKAAKAARQAEAATKEQPVAEQEIELEDIAEEIVEETKEEPVAAQKPAADSTIVSVESELAARSSLANLSSMIVKPSDGSENTLEGMVREMLRPMLKEWLDSNLPRLVEGMVAKEIARITGRAL